MPQDHPPRRHVNPALIAALAGGAISPAPLRFPRPAAAVEPKPEKPLPDFVREFREANKLANGEGAINIEVIDGRVVVVFSKSVDWLAFTGQQASDLADLLNAKGLEARGIKPECGGS